jgi:SAM-dependent methyltransferase
MAKVMVENEEICAVCLIGLPKVLIEHLADDRFGCPTEVQIFQCSYCGHCFCSPKLRASEIGPLYEKFYGRSESTTIGFHPTVKSQLLRWIIGENNLGQFATSPELNRKLLDVGSGDCQNLWDANYLGFDAYGFDVDRTSELIGKRFGLKVSSGASVSEAYPNQIFDFIQLNQVLEHYVDPEQQLKILREHLADNGRLYISTPNSASLLRKITGKAWINWHVPYHQNHFSVVSLKFFVEKNGWSIVRHSTVTPLVWLVLQLRNSVKSVKYERLRKILTAITSGRGSRLIELGFCVLVFLPLRLIDFLKLGDSQTMIIVDEK